MGSSPLRSDGSRNGQAGEAGPVEQCSAEAKILKLKAKGLSGCHPSRNNQGSQTGGHDNLLKETSSGQKQMFKGKLALMRKKKDAYSMLQS